MNVISKRFATDGLSTWRSVPHGGAAKARNR
jgi:hypothetical protein